jgi:hypothetical protein
MNTPDAQTVAAVASSVIALAALVFSIVSFQRQQVRAERLAVASVRPLLWINRQRYVDLKAVQLRNYGLGPAIIRKASFTKDGQSTNRLVDLLDIRPPGERSEGIVWETFVNLPERRAIPAQGEVVLIKESLEHLTGQGIDEKTGLRLLAQFDAQASGIEVEIEFEDILGTRMEAFTYKFR